MKIRDGRSQAEEYDLAANLDISEQNLTLKHQGWARRSHNVVLSTDENTLNHIRKT